MGRNWCPLWGGSAISALGDGIFLAALALLATTLAQDPRLIAGVSFFGTLPWLLAALPAGAADRYDNRRLLLWALWAQGPSWRPWRSSTAHTSGFCTPWRS